MNDRSPTCEQLTLPDILNAISSQESADGRLLSELLDGPTTGLFGQDHVPASRSAPPASKRASPIPGTSGQSGSRSSAGAVLQSSLESKLQEQLSTAGSTLFSLTWKRKATPAGRPYYQLAASARRTSDSEHGFVAVLVGTPTSRDHKDGASTLENTPVNAPLGRQALGSDLNWIPCTDGKARPVEPGTFPLAHGIPGRVGRLRAYGNAIVPQAAAAFVGAFMDGRTDRLNVAN